MPLLNFSEKAGFERAVEKFVNQPSSVYYHDVGYCYHVTVGKTDDFLAGTLPKTEDSLDLLMKNSGRLA